MFTNNNFHEICTLTQLETAGFNFIQHIFILLIFCALNSQVLDEGKLVEFDEPYLLLQNKDSLFSKMVEHTSKHLATNLYDVARQAFFSRHELTEDCDLDPLRKSMNESTTLQQQQQQGPDNVEDFELPSPRVRSSSSLEKERLLFESTV